MKLYFYNYFDRTNEKNYSQIISAENKMEADDKFFEELLKRSEEIMLEQKMTWQYLCFGELKNTHVNLRD